MRRRTQCGRSLDQHRDSRSSNLTEWGRECVGRKNGTRTPHRYALPAARCVPSSRHKISQSSLSGAENRQIVGFHAWPRGARVRRGRTCTDQSTRREKVRCMLSVVAFPKTARAQDSHNGAPRLSQRDRVPRPVSCPRQTPLEQDPRIAARSARRGKRSGAPQQQNAGGSEHTLLDSRNVSARVAPARYPPRVAPCYLDRGEL